MALSPDDGCRHCGTIDATHMDTCPSRRRELPGAGPRPPVRPWTPCELMPNPDAASHLHCIHGHVRDCPNQGECEIVERPAVNA